MINKKESFSALFREHVDSLVLYAMQRVSRRADAEDIVQETFVSFWKQQAKVENPIAYLYRSVRNQSINTLRAEKRRQSHESQKIPRLFYLPVDELEQEQFKDQIEKLLHDLPLDQREAVVLRIWGELSFSQIAETVDIPESTARSRYRYALENIRKNLSARNPK